jgi:hypothetical protein
MSRSYTVHDVECPSVTTVLATLDKSNALLGWAVKCCTQFIRDNKANRDQYPTLDALLYAAQTNWRSVRDDAADTGTQIHDMIEKYIKHGHDVFGTVPDNVANGFLAFLDWEKTNKVEWLESERTIFHPELLYAGTLDAVAIIDGKKYVIDFKSSAGFYDTFGPQIAAYRAAYMAETGVEIHGCGILRLDKKTGIPEWKDYTKRQDRDFNAFSKLLDYYYAAANRRLKNNFRAVEGKI